MIEKEKPSGRNELSTFVQRVTNRVGAVLEQIGASLVVLNDHVDLFSPQAAERRYQRLLRQRAEARVKKVTSN